ncbi:MAG: DUF3109 family protein [Muribaculaceae bacterium]|nr:DUF3109 family protein [Muribaculaceae bacterium]
MLQIQDTLVSLDLIEEFFCCDLDRCLGECCIEGDAGAPVTAEEVEKLRENMHLIRPLLTPAAQRVIDEQGPAYFDSEGDLVTSIVDGRDCVFTTYAPGGKCLCALEAASRAGKLPPLKPISCHLYPVRLKDYGGFTAVNYHRWKICRSAVSCGRTRGLRVYEFLKEPLIRRFGQEWYEELDRTAREYLKQYPVSPRR